MNRLPIETAQAREEKRFKIIPAVYLLLQNEKKEYLFGLRKNTGYADGMWGLPAGHLDGFETMRQGLSREAQEELKIIIAPENMQVILMMHRLAPSRECVDCFIQASQWQGDIVIGEPNKCAELRFFSLNSLPDNIILQEKYALQAIQSGMHYCEYGW